LLVQVKFDSDLVSDAIGDENFIEEARRWKPDPLRKANSDAIQGALKQPSVSKEQGIQTTGRGKPKAETRKKPGRRGGIRPDF
jgi:hypothetical protein